MRDIFLCLIMMGIMGIGYLIVDRFGRFMDKHYKGNSGGSRGECKSAVVLSSDEKSTAELAREIQALKDRHMRVEIVVCCDGDREEDDRARGMN